VLETTPSGSSPKFGRMDVVQLCPLSTQFALANKHLLGPWVRRVQQRGAQNGDAKRSSGQARQEKVAEVFTQWIRVQIYDLQNEISE
jgi:hypothetical protein